jgi:hypothetical protein
MVVLKFIPEALKNYDCELELLGDRDAPIGDLHSFFALV